MTPLACPLARPQFLRVHPRLQALAAGAAMCFLAGSANAELIYTEDFNTDGDGTRYTTQGRGLVLLNIEGNQEPSYWTHSSDVTKAGEIVGVVVPAAARRAALVFQSAVPEALLTDDGKKLIDNTIKWLSGGSAALKVLYSPSITGEGDTFLEQRLIAAGHTVTADDTSLGLPAATTLNLVIASSGALPAPTRFTRYGVPMLTFNGPNHDDELVTSIGAANLSFDPGDITITDPSHPIAAGLPQTFKFVTEAVGLDTVGTTVPENSRTIATYTFANPDTGLDEIRPLLVVIEKGTNLLGGAFKGSEGAGFWAGADMNEPTISECCASTTEPRSLTLKSVNVAGKNDLRLTMALAATDIDFENTDFIRIMVDPDGDGAAEFSELVNFTVPTPNDKFFTDPAGSNKLSVAFREVSYNLPAGATDLVVRIESTSTFFNEIVGFDNIRIHSGPLAVVVPPLGNTTVTRAGETLTLAWTGGAAPFALQYKSELGNTWADIATTSSRSISVPAAGPAGFFRIQAASTKNVQLFRAALTGAAEKPAPTDSTATGSGWLALDGTTATYAVSYSGLKGNVTGAHIHGPADETVSAPVMFGITGALGSTFGTFSGVQTGLTAQQVSDIVAGKTYFNIHSVPHPGGEIRGQIKP